jgi:hypothetical protein
LIEAIPKRSDTKVLSAQGEPDLDEIIGDLAEVASQETWPPW